MKDPAKDNATVQVRIHTLKFLYIADTPVSDISPVQPLLSGGLKLVQN